MEKTHGTTWMLKTSSPRSHKNQPSSTVCVRFVAAWFEIWAMQKLMKFWSGKRISRMSNHSLLLLSLVQDPGCFGLSQDFLLKTVSKSCDIGKPVTPSTWGYFKLYLMDFMPRRCQKKSNLNPTKKAWEMCAVLCYKKCKNCKNQQKSASLLNRRAFAVLTQNCWPMRGVALFPRVSWGFAKSLLGRLLARSLESIE